MNGGADEPGSEPTSAADGEPAAERAGRARRLSRWDRPRPPHDWRWVVSGIGKSLIVLGVLMFAFVAYLLWGTGIEYSQAQNELDDQWEELVAGASSTTVPPEPVPTSEPSSGPDDPAPTTTAVTTTTPGPSVQPIAPPAAGDVVARLTVPAIDIDEVNVVSGVGVEELKKGPGHFPETPLPGQLGNAAIAGHRTTYGGPFYHVDELEIGDEIIVETLAGRFVYKMTGSEIVSPSEYRVVATTDPTKATLTLTSCHPLRSAKQRIIIYAELDVAQSSPVGVMTSNYLPVDGQPLPGPETEIPGDDVEPTTVPPDTSSPPTTETATSDPTPTTEAPDAGDTTGDDPLGDDTADAFAHGWFDDPGAWPQIALWGVALIAVTVGSYLLARRVRRLWVGALAGFVPVVFVLYFFFQNVNRLLPPGL